MNNETTVLPTAGQLRRETRLLRIARALASGCTVTEIADAEGISRNLASKEANSAECRHLLMDFVNNERDEMQADRRQLPAAKNDN